MTPRRQTNARAGLRLPGKRHVRRGIGHEFDAGHETALPHRADMLRMPFLQTAQQFRHEPDFRLEVRQGLFVCKDF